MNIITDKQTTFFIYDPLEAKTTVWDLKDEGRADIGAALCEKIESRWKYVKV